MTREEKIAATAERIKAAKRAASFPKCTDCVFYEAAKKVGSASLCRQPLVASLRPDVHGRAHYTDISITNARTKEDLCGPEGDLFVEKTFWEKRQKYIDGTVTAGVIILCLAIALSVVIGIGYGIYAAVLYFGWDNIRGFLLVAGIIAAVLWFLKFLIEDF